ncbi:MAG: YkgJ family cysteine cluster protein [Candidatus Scalinduaceae bacterium]
MHIQNNQPWYKDGLRFECQRSGRCCMGEPGVVRVNKREINLISSSLSITQNLFAKRYLRIVNGHYSLLEYKNGDCIMYENGCKIYAVRPSQCRTFPFWKSNLENQEEWEKLKNICPGVGKGKLHTLKEIKNYLKPDLSDL